MLAPSQAGHEISPNLSLVLAYLKSTKFRKQINAKFKAGLKEHLVKVLGE